MTSTASGERRGPRRLQWWIAGGVVTALVATVAVIASGYDARQTPREEPGVWVARESGQYARVNTDTGELDLVRKVSDPSGIIQSGGRGAVLSNGNGRAWSLDPSNPVDLDVKPATTGGEPAATSAQPASNQSAQSQDSAESVRMPEGTRDIVSAGRFVAIRTESGAVYAGELAPSEAEDLGANAATANTADTADLERRLSSLVRVDPSGEGQKKPSAGADAGYRATAITLTSAGVIGAYSSADGSVLRFDIAAGEPVGRADQVPDAAGKLQSPQLALLGDDWVLLDGESGRLWRSGGGQTTVKLEGSGVLQGSLDPEQRKRVSAGERRSGQDAAVDAVLIADTGGLLAVSSGGTAKRVLQASGAPAQPTAVEGAVYAAWLGQRSGTLWNSNEGDKPLAFDDAARESGDLQPTIRSNGSRAVLNEMRTGMLWTLPDGKRIPLSQWSISDPPKQDRGSVVVTDVTDQQPPTAVNDTFGVRAGASAPLPVLLNDFDPNRRDVLTIVPDSLTASSLPKPFGSLELMPDGQSLMVRVAAKASGTATFTYRVTDGALTSNPATVTLRVAPEAENTAPAWCPVDGCRREWRVPPLAPGGTLVAPLLDGWVDPEGDVMTLTGVEPLRKEDPLRAMVTADGRLALRHTDPNAGAAEMTLRVTVTDSRGKQTRKNLGVSVQPGAAAEFTASAATVRVGQTMTLQPLERVAGGSGSFALLDATSPSPNLRVTSHTSNGTIDLQAAQAGSTTVSVMVRDTGTGSEVTGQLRVTATPAGPPLALPELRAFVRPLTDTTVEILDAIPGAGSRALAVQSAKAGGGELQASVIDHSKVHVSGSTPDGGPGRIGAVDVAVAEGSTTATGKLTVFQVAANAPSGVIAVADTATVRAGSVVDIRVLDNDVAAPGERLVLQPEIVGSGTKGELAFASGNVLRYLAPKKPGTYRLSYTAYGASDPTSGDVGAVIVTVLPTGSNRDPQPAALTARVAAGATAQVTVPLSGVDPDGDRVRLTGVQTEEGSGIVATLNDTVTGIEVSAATGAKSGTKQLKYTVVDPSGARGTGKLGVVVLPEQEAAGIVATTDSLRVGPGGDAVVLSPLDNDVDQSGGTLELTSVTPNLPGGKTNPAYRALAGRLDLSEMKQGRVSIEPGRELGTDSFRYTVRSSKTKSTADGLIVVQTSEHVGAQAPAVSDTVLNVRDRADLASKGVDVLTGKTRWATGDVSKLKLSIWGSRAADYRVKGSRILGQYRAEGDTVVFKLSGTDASGKQVATYGLLLILPLDELPLTLKPGLKPLTVDENQQTEVDVADLVDVGPSDRVELRKGSFAVGRAQASCQAVSGDRLRYSAGGEAPWTDSCLIEARLVGQDRWTALPVPVVIVPKQPVAQAQALTRTVDPGATQTISLTDMVTWEGGRKGDTGKLSFAESGGTSLFDLQQNGSSLRVTARADAVPGTQETVSIAVSGAGDSRAPLTLQVGQAPRDLPRGGTVALQCTVGSSCQAQLVGVAGEHDPFAGKTGGGLKLASVNGDSCTFGSFSRVGDSGISVSWPNARGIGGTCRVGFTVRDAQGRTGEGTVEFDAQGLPGTPSIQQTGYTASSASFTVTLGAQQAHPAVSGVTLSGGGSGSCTAVGPATYQCTADGLSNGQKHQFTAQAVNAVGSSQASTAVTAWAYSPPRTPTVEASPLEDRQNRNSGKGAVRVVVSDVSKDTKQIRLQRIGGDTETVEVRPEQSTFSRDFRDLAAGSTAGFTATPVTGFDVPNIGGGNTTGTPGSDETTVIGAPAISSVTLVSTGDNSARINYSGTEGATATYTISKGSLQDPPDCLAGGGQNEPDFGGLRKYSLLRGMVCLRSAYGMNSAVSDAKFIGNELRAPRVTYTILAAPTAVNDGVIYDVAKNQDGTPQLDVQSAESDTKLIYSNTGTEEFALDPASAAEFKVKQCYGDSPCSAEANVRWRNAPTVVTAKPNGQCLPLTNGSVGNPSSDELKTHLTISAAAAPDATVKAGTPANGLIPVTITWGGSFQALQQATLNVCTTP